MAILFEFEDKPWFPAAIRGYMMDYLRFVINTGNLYKPITPLIAEVLDNTGENRITDLCSGSGGNITKVHSNLQLYMQKQVHITLTDKYPNLQAFRHISESTQGNINYVSAPVDATNVPASIEGIRTIFSAFHHFSKQAAVEVIRSAIQAHKGIAVFDGADKNIVFMLAMLVLQPVGFVLFTPFIKPFSWKRLLFTYLLPVIPLCTIWDGLVSATRLYTPVQMLAIAQEADNNNYVWKAGKKRNRLGMGIAYLVGYPRHSSLNKLIS